MAENKTNLSDAAWEARKAYKRRWAKEHQESVKESQRKFWEKRAAEIIEAEQNETEEA